MTKFELIKENKKSYENLTKKIEGMSGLAKLVAKEMTLEWLKGNKWLGGLSDSKANKAVERISMYGYDPMDIMDEFDRQTTWAWL